MHTLRPWSIVALLVACAPADPADDPSDDPSDDTGQAEEVAEPPCGTSDADLAWRTYRTGTLAGYGAPFDCDDVQVGVFRDEAGVNSFYDPYATTYGDYSGTLDASAIDYDAHAVLTTLSSCSIIGPTMRVDAVVQRDDGSLCVAVTIEKPGGQGSFPTMPWVLVTLPAADYEIGEIIVSEEKAYTY